MGLRYTALSAFLLLLFPSIVQAKSDIPDAIDKRKQPVLIMNLSIDRTTGTIGIVSLKKATGFVPDYKNPTAMDLMTVSVSAKSSTKHYHIPLPLIEAGAPPEASGLPKWAKPSKKLDIFNYTAVIPHEPGAKVSIEKRFREPGKKELTATVAFSQPVANEPTRISASHLPITSMAVQSAGGFTDPISIETVFDGDPTNTDPSTTVDIVFISSEFTTADAALFSGYTDKQTDILVGFRNFPGKDPFPANRHLLKIRRVLSSNSFIDPYGNVSQSMSISYVSSLGIPFDQIVVTRKPFGPAYAYLGGGFQVITAGNSVDATSPLTFTHELAHSFGNILDEYVNTSYSSDVDLYYQNRNCKDDPDTSWPPGTTGGSYIGCNYVWNLYKPELDSLMKNIYPNELEFNSPSKKLLNDAFAAYTGKGLSFDSNSLSYIYVPSNGYLNSSTTMNLYNFGLKPISINITLESADHRLSIFPDTGTIPAGPYSNSVLLSIYYNFSQTVSPAIIQNAITITASDGVNTLEKKFPIKFVILGQNDIPSISWNTPNPDTIIDMNSINPVSLSIINPLAIKSVQYYYKNPWDLVNNSEGRVFLGKTIYPFTGNFSPITTIDSYFDPGVYQLYAVAQPYSWSAQKVKTSEITIQVKAAANTTCQNPHSYDRFSCSDVLSNPRCFLGASDCASYCCPILPPSPIPTITPTPTPPPIPGDANGDKKVNGLDFTLWAYHFGETYPVTGPLGSANPGDFDGNSYVDTNDFVIWKNNYSKY